MSKFRKVRGARNQFVPDGQFKKRPRVLEMKTTRELVGERVGFLTKTIYETLDNILRENGEVIRFRRAPTPEEKAAMEDAERNFFYKHNYYRWMLKQPFRVLSGPWPFFDDLFLEEEKKSDWFNSAWYDDIRFQGQEFANIGMYKKDDLPFPRYQMAPKFRRDINRIIQLWRVNPEFGARMDAIAKGEIEEPDQFWWFPEWIKYRAKRLNEGLIDLDEGLHRGEQTIFMFEELEADDYIRLQLCVELGKLDNNPDYFQQCERTHLRYYITPTSLATRRMWVIRPGDDGTQERFLPRPEAMKHNVYVHHMNDSKWLAEHGYLSEEEAQRVLHPELESNEKPEFEELSEEEKLEQVKELGKQREAVRERFEKIMNGEITFDKKIGKKGKVYYIERVNGEDFQEAREKAETIMNGGEEEKENKSNLPKWWFLPRKERILNLVERQKEEINNWEKNKNDYQILAPDKKGEWKVVVDSTRESYPELWNLLWYLMEDWGDWRYRENMTMEQFKSRTNWYDWDENTDRGLENEELENLEPDSWKLLDEEGRKKRWYRFNRIQLKMGECKNAVITNEFQKKRLKDNPEYARRIVNNKLYHENKGKAKFLASYENYGFIVHGNQVAQLFPGKAKRYQWEKILKEQGIRPLLNPKAPYDIDNKNIEVLLKDFQQDYFRNTILNPLAFCEFSLNGRGRDMMTRAEKAVQYLYNGMWRQLGDKYGVRYLEVVPTYRHIEKIIKSENDRIREKIEVIKDTRKWLKENDPELYKAIEKRNKGKWTLPVVLDENQKDKNLIFDDWILIAKEAVKHLSINPEYQSVGDEITTLYVDYFNATRDRKKQLIRIYNQAVKNGIIDPIPEEEFDDEEEHKEKQVSKCIQADASRKCKPKERT